MTQDLGFSVNRAERPANSLRTMIPPEVELELPSALDPLTPLHAARTDPDRGEVRDQEAAGPIAGLRGHAEADLRKAHGRTAHAGIA